MSYVRRAGSIRVLQALAIEVTEGVASYVAEGIRTTVKPKRVALKIPANARVVIAEVVVVLLQLRV